MPTPRPTVKDLTSAERLVIARRRATLSQDELIKKLYLKCSRRGYQRFEDGSATKTQWDDLLKQSKAASALIRSVEHLEPHEQCFLARRRAGLTLKEAAKKSGYTKTWYGMLERGQGVIDPLIAFWFS